MSLTTIAHYDQTALAHIAQAKLEAEGIDSTLLDENTTNWFWHYSVATGGIRLQVNEADVSRAQEILQSRDEHVVEVTARVEDEPPKCPKCQSEHVQRRRFTWPTLLAALFTILLAALILGFLTTCGLMFVLLLVGYWRMPRWQCNDCGHRWKSS